MGIREPVIDSQGRQRGYKLWIVCPHCEEGRWVPEATTKTKTFSGFCQKCHAKYTTGQFDKHSRWKGGRCTSSDGYVMIKLSPDDPYYPMARKSGYIREHRLVMARHLNRLLGRDEVVHHINHIRDDNQIENLELIRTGVYHLLDSNGRSQLTRLKERKR